MAVLTISGAVELVGHVDVRTYGRIPFTASAETCTTPYANGYCEHSPGAASTVEWAAARARVCVVGLPGQAQRPHCRTSARDDRQVYDALT